MVSSGDRFRQSSAVANVSWSKRIWSAPAGILFLTELTEEVFLGREIRQFWDTSLSSYFLYYSLNGKDYRVLGS